MKDPLKIFFSRGVYPCFDGTRSRPQDTVYALCGIFLECFFSEPTWHPLFRRLHWVVSFSLFSQRCISLGLNSKFLLTRDVFHSSSFMGFFPFCTVWVIRRLVSVLFKPLVLFQEFSWFTLVYACNGVVFFLRYRVSQTFRRSPVVFFSLSQGS